jgi:hypothetical protein
MFAIELLHDSQRQWVPYLYKTNLSNRALHGLTVLQLEGEALHLR